MLCHRSHHARSLDLACLHLSIGDPRRYGVSRRRRGCAFISRRVALPKNPMNVRVLKQQACTSLVAYRRHELQHLSLADTRAQCHIEDVWSDGKFFRTQGL